MTRHPMSSSAAPRKQAGFTLISVLIAILIMGIGLLAIARTTVNVTAAETQNQNVASMAAISNGFWGVLQANSTLFNSTNLPLLNPSTPYTASSTVAYAPLQTWLTQTTSALPGATVNIVTYGDPNTGLGCGSGGTGTNCTVVLTLQWAQAASTNIAAATRSQVFYYEF